MFRDYLPAYYKNSKVMHNVLEALETEYARLKKEVQITEDTFFVLLADKYIDRHLSDLGILQSGDNLDAKRSHILARLRGQGTLTVNALKNVVNAYVYGSVWVEEYPGQYLFKIKFVNEKGTPASFDDIKAVIEEIKPAHLAVEYIFTYRVWQEVKSNFTTWSGVKSHNWGYMLNFDVVNKYLHIADNGCVYFCGDSVGNARLEWIDNRAYAVRDESRILHIAYNDRAYLCVHGAGTSKLVWDNNRAYAVRMED